MKIRINERTRELYAKNCPRSTYKCSSFKELDYKIQRCIDLGLIRTKGDVTLVQYYNNQFQIIDSVIVNIQKTKKCFMISSYKKTEYFNKMQKVLV
ncbi:hypothetical protein JCM16418A_16570 [Paenibacillus pini]